MLTKLTSTEFLSFTHLKLLRSSLFPFDFVYQTTLGYSQLSSLLYLLSHVHTHVTCIERRTIFRNFFVYSSSKHEWIIELVRERFSISFGHWSLSMTLLVFFVQISLYTASFTCKHYETDALCNWLNLLHNCQSDRSQKFQHQKK